MKEIFWIDNVRALCMIIIYWRHTESYCRVAAWHPELTDLFYVNAFFIVSGYLHFKKLFDDKNDYDIKKQLADLLFKLVLPVIFFSAVMIVPKYLLFRHQDLAVSNVVYDILGGVASWFVAALAISKLLLILLSIFLRKNILPYLIAGALLAVGGMISGCYDPTPFPWFYKSGMIATWLMALGGVWYRYENHLSVAARVIGVVFSSAIIGLCAYFNLHPVFSPMSAKFTFVGTITCIAVCFIVIMLCHLIPNNHVGKFLGRNSILYYFFCNASPALVCVLFFRVCKMNVTPYLAVALTFASLLLSTMITMAIKYRLSFLLDLRKLRKSVKHENPV